jgi:tetratricopeptide (TPR) repeat protein
VANQELEHFVATEQEDEGIEAASRLIEIEENYSDIYINKANVYSDLGKIDEAIEYYDKGIKLNPENPNGHYSKAVLLTHLDKYDEANEYYDKAIEKKPELFEAWSNKGLIASILGNFNESIAFYDKAIGINPESFNSWYGKGILFWNNDRYEEALNAIEKAIEFDPNDADSWDYKGLILSSIGKHSKAVEAHKRSVELDPNNSFFRNNYANGLRIKGSFDEAEREVLKALELDKRNPYALGTLGDIFADEQFYEEAVNTYHQALRYPLDLEKEALSDTYTGLGYSYLKLKNIKEAIKYFEMAKKEDSFNVKAAKNIRALKTNNTDNKGNSNLVSYCIIVPLFASYILLILEIITEKYFIFYSIVLICLLIFVNLYTEFNKFQVGNIKFEMNDNQGYVTAKNQYETLISKIER